VRFGPGEAQRAILTFPGEVSLRLSWGLGPQERSLPSWVEINQDSPSVQLHLETKQMRFAPPEAEIFSLSVPPGFSPAGEEAIP
jgi:hypothetical protein